MRIAILTSSRADYGIYLPLLKRLKEDDFFHVSIIAFGTHLSHFYGYTANRIEGDGFKIDHKIESLVHGDSPEAIATATALTSLKFASFWGMHSADFDLIICLGDRYEMYAAISATIPFNLPVAHIHAGETSLGAIDNAMRHSISLVARFFFVATPAYKRKVAELIGKEEHIYYVGALSLDNNNDLNLLSKKAFQAKYDIDLAQPTILITLQPETIAIEKNELYVKELVAALTELDYQIVITLPNADTAGNIIRKELLAFTDTNERAYAVESFGTLGYFSCMKHCAFLLGNTSSGIIEAASFDKMVINIGDRQEGRAQSNNMINVPIEKNAILAAIKALPQNQPEKIQNIYWKGDVADQIVQILKQHIWKEINPLS